MEREQNYVDVWDKDKNAIFVDKTLCTQWLESLNWVEKCSEWFFGANY